MTRTRVHDPGIGVREECIDERQRLTGGRGILEGASIGRDAEERAQGDRGEAECLACGLEHAGGLRMVRMIGRAGRDENVGINASHRWSALRP